MSILTKLFRRKDNPAMRSALAFYGMGQAVWTRDDYHALTEAGYRNCAVVFGCVSLIARSASRINWVLQRTRGRGGNWDEVDAHPLLDLLSRPNPREAGMRFIEQVIGYLLLAGNTYITRVPAVDNVPPKFLYSLRPDRMRILAGTWQNPVAGYTYGAGLSPVPFATEAVLHIKEFSPTDDFYGLSRLSVAARHIDVMNQATEWNKKLLQNDMRPAGALKMERQLQAEQRKALREELSEARQGYKNAGEFLILEGGMEWMQMSISPKDIDWLNGQKFTLRQICSIFGVPSELLGDSENKTYSNVQEARKALYNEAILPIMDMVRDEFNHWLVPLYGDGLWLDYDRDAIDALQEDRGQKYAYLAQADWLTVNEKRQATGYDEITEGDVILVPFTNVPLGSGGLLGDDGDGKQRAIKVVRKSFWTDKDRQEKLWRTFEARVKKREKTFTATAKAFLERQARDAAKTARDVGNILRLSAGQLLDVEAETKAYAKAFKTWYEDHFIRAGNAGMRAAKGEFFDDAELKADIPTSWVFNMTEELAEELRRLIFESGTKVNETTLEVIRETLIKAQTENMTVDEFARAVRDKVAEFSIPRSQLWARTESTKVDNYGQLEGFRQTEFVERKGWLCSFVPDSREEHKLAHGQERLLSEPFDVGRESLMYPGDRAGSAGNVCNCYCDMYPIVD